MKTIDKLAPALRLYARASGKVPEQVIREKGADFGYRLKQELRKITPAKKQVTNERLAALRGGEGVHIRQAVAEAVAAKRGVPLGPLQTWFKNAKPGYFSTDDYTAAGRRLTLSQALVKRELAVRESGRMFTSRSAQFPGGRRELPDTGRAAARSSRTLSVVEVEATNRSAQAVFSWGDFSYLSMEAAQALGRAKGNAAVLLAMESMVQNMIPYLERKLGAGSADMLK
jgi:hypothetical protein